LSGGSPSASVHVPSPRATRSANSLAMTASRVRRLRTTPQETRRSVSCILSGDLVTKWCPDPAMSVHPCLHSHAGSAAMRARGVAFRGCEIMRDIVFESPRKIQAIGDGDTVGAVAESRPGSGTVR
jgi:hypothetical protein